MRHILSISLCAFLVMLRSPTWADSPDNICYMTDERIPTTYSSLQDSNLDEISGLAISKNQRNYMWVHNDSGDAANVYALDLSGQLMATWRVRGAAAFDWEDMALGACDVADNTKGDCLFIADIGNNSESRTDQMIYRVREPVIPQLPDATQRDTETADAYPVVYDLPADDPNPSPDAESLMVHPLTGKLYIVTKEKNRGRVLESDPPGAPGMPLIFRPIGEVPLHKATGADLSSNGAAFVVRGYFEAREYVMFDGDIAKALRDLPGDKIILEFEPQGETIAYMHGVSNSLLGENRYKRGSPTPFDFVTISEKRGAKIWRYEFGCNNGPHIPEPTDMGDTLDMSTPQDMPVKQDMMIDDRLHTPDLSTADMNSDMSNGDNTSGSSDEGCAAAGAAAPAALTWLLIPLSGRRPRRLDGR